MLSCWLLWAESAQRRRSQLARLRKCLRRVTHGKAGAAFNSWVDKAFGEPDPKLRALAHFANQALSKVRGRGGRVRLGRRTLTLALTLAPTPALT